MRILKFVPSFLWILLAYNLFLQLGTWWVNDSAPLKFVLFEVNLASGVALAIHLEHLLLIAGMASLYFEILKSTRSYRLTVIDHTLSTIVFIGFFTQFLLMPSGGTFSFLLLTLMSLLDVVSGFTISIANARSSQFITPSHISR
ncbi:MAG: hypothetical protein VYD54_14335 [Bdellovibrionota bacterium]|nr:hypothetical protein [Bdellovibrionota bacterium]